MTTTDEALAALDTLQGYAENGAPDLEVVEIQHLIEAIRKAIA